MDFELPRREIPAINLSALIDITFILVIFVVLAANFNRIQDLEVSLPDAHASSDADPASLSIIVPSDGSLVVDGVAVAMEEVLSVLKQKRSDYDSVLLLADETASVQRAVRVLGDAQLAGFEAVGIATDPKRKRK